MASTSIALPPPIGGLNLKDALSDMPVADVGPITKSLQGRESAPMSYNA